MLLSGVSGPLFGIWHRVVGGQAIRSPHCSEIQECCNPGSEMCRASDLSVGTDMFACFCHGKCTYVEAERGESPPGSTQHHIIKLGGISFFFLHTLKGEPLQPSLMAGAHGIAFLLEWLTFSGWAKYFGEAGSNKNCFRSEVRVCCGCFEGKILEAWLDNASSSVRRSGVFFDILKLKLNSCSRDGFAFKVRQRLQRPDWAAEEFLFAGYSVIFSCRADRRLNF